MLPADRSGGGAAAWGVYLLSMNRALPARCSCRLDHGDDRPTLHPGPKPRVRAGPNRPDATPPR